jgi:hypothetical protein
MARLHLEPNASSGAGYASDIEAEHGRSPACRRAAT